MSRKLIIIVGLPLSGKSTWIEEYQRNNDCLIVSNDWIRENIFHVKYYHSINPALWTISDGCIRILLSQDKTVIVDGVNHTRFVRNEFIKTAQDMEAEVRIVYINTSLETCLRRNDKLPNERLISMSEEFEIPTDEEAPVEIVAGVEEVEFRTKPNAKIIDMTIEEYYKEAKDEAELNPQWRYGQALFNVLRDVRPDLSEQVRSTDLDPFYNDVDNFKEWLEKHWDSQDG